MTDCSCARGQLRCKVLCFDIIDTYTTVSTTVQEFRQAVAKGRWDAARESVQACVYYVARLLVQVVAEMAMCVAHGVEPASWASRSARHLTPVMRAVLAPLSFRSYRDFVDRVYAKLDDLEERSSACAAGSPTILLALPGAAPNVRGT